MYDWSDAALALQSGTLGSESPWGAASACVDDKRWTICHTYDQTYCDGCLFCVRGFCVRSVSFLGALRVTWFWIREFIPNFRVGVGGVVSTIGFFLQDVFVPPLPPPRSVVEAADWRNRRRARLITCGSHVSSRRA